jgi:hypothetical protein
MLKQNNPAKNSVNYQLQLGSKQKRTSSMSLVSTVTSAFFSLSKTIIGFLSNTPLINGCYNKNINKATDEKLKPEQKQLSKNL